MSHALALLSAIIFCNATGEKISFEALIDDLARREVVILGEEHDNAEGHALEAAIVKALFAKRPDLVISMEMFERDAQGVLTDYLRGRIDEATFLKRSRPWKPYAKDYRELVEFAREKGLDVIAANAPTALARKVSTGKLSNADREFGLPRSSTDPKDRYFELFRDVMKDHVGANGDVALERMYAAQCVKDDAMAEAVTDYLAQHPHRRPLIVHVVGKFHCEYGLGTAARILSRRPVTQLGIVTMVASEKPEELTADAHRDKAHFVLGVKAEPKPPVAVAVPETKTDTVVAAAAPKTDGTATAEVAAKPATDPPAQDAKPALGIMPDYAATEPGVTVSSVREGGSAEKGGILDGDRIIRLGKTRIDDLEGYMEALSELKPGQTIDVTLLRGGAEKTVKVTLGTRTQ